MNDKTDSNQNSFTDDRLILFSFNTAQKWSFLIISIKDFFSKCDQMLETVDLVTFKEEILIGKFHLLYIVISKVLVWYDLIAYWSYLTKTLPFCWKELFSIEFQKLQRLAKNIM